MSRDGDPVAAISTGGSDGAFIEAEFGGFPTEESLAAMHTAYADAFKPAEVAAGFIKIFKEGFRFPL